jgi:hypothetical protein
MIGGGKRRVLSLAGRAADIVSISNVPFVARNDAGLSPAEEAARRTGYVREASGSRFASLDIESSPYFSDVTDEPATGLERVGAIVGVETDVLVDHPNVLVGSVDTIVETLERRRDELGINYVTVQQPQLEVFAPVVARLSGS